MSETTTGAGATAAYEALHTGAGVFRPPVGAILASGADRLRFLHGMLSADVKALTPGSGCFAFQLDGKGKILADLRLVARADDLLMVCGVDEVQAVGMALAGFVIADDVELADYGDERTWIAVEGPGARDVVQRVCGAAPADADYAQAACADGVHAVHLVRDSWSGQPGVWLWVPLERADALTDALVGGGAVAVDEPALELVRIERGVFRHRVDFDERTLLQESGLLHGVAFDKGCYRGQETVERIRSRGAVQRMLTGLLVDGAPPEVGAEIRVDGVDKPIGAVTSSTRSPRFSGGLALGYVRVAHRAPGTKLRVGDTFATVSDLPFSPERTY